MADTQINVGFPLLSGFRGLQKKIDSKHGQKHFIYFLTSDRQRNDRNVPFS